MVIRVNALIMNANALFFREFYAWCFLMKWNEKNNEHCKPLLSHINKQQRKKQQTASAIKRQSNSQKKYMNVKLLINLFLLFYLFCFSVNSHVIFRLIGWNFSPWLLQIMWNAFDNRIEYKMESRPHISAELLFVSPNKNKQMCPLIWQITASLCFRGLIYIMFMFTLLNSFLFLSRTFFVVSCFFFFCFFYLRSIKSFASL